MVSKVSLVLIYITMASNAIIIGRDTPSLKKGDPDPPAKPGQLRLYAMRFCPFCERVELCAARKGTNMEIVNVNLSKNEKPEWLLQKNLHGGVPIIQQDNMIVVDSLIIMQLLDELDPKRSLLPQDPYERAIQRMFLQSLLPLCDTVVDFMHSSTLSGDMEKLESGIQRAESLFKKQTFYGGSKIGFVDIAFYPFIERLDILAAYNNMTLFDTGSFPGQQFPKLDRWYKAMKSDPDIAKTSQRRENLAKFMIGKVEGKADYDIGIPGHESS